MAKLLHMNAPVSADENLSIESEVLVYRKKPENKWVGPYLVLDLKEKSVCIDHKVATVQVLIEKGKFTKRPSVGASTGCSAIQAPDRGWRDVKMEDIWIL